MKTLGDKIRTLYLEQNLTQKELAQKVGIAYQNINGIINNRQNPSFTTLQKIADVLGVTVEYLLPEDMESQSDPLTTGKRIQLLCQKKCITKIELSRRAKVFYNTVQNITNDRTKYQHSTLQKIANALEVPIEYLDPTINDRKQNIGIIGRRIRKICAEKNISQTMLAQKLGVTRQAITDIIYRGNTVHRRATLKKIADALEVPLERLTSKNDEEFSEMDDD